MQSQNAACRDEGASGKLQPVKVVVIVTTYDNPQSLRLVLEALAAQTHLDFDLIVADDGSGPATCDMVSGFAKAAPFPVQHVWQPKNGYGKPRILNAAIRSAKAADYLIFNDGDCIPCQQNVAVHLRNARRFRAVVGGKIQLNRELTVQLQSGQLPLVALDRSRFWLKHFREARRGERALVRSVPLLRTLLDKRKTRRVLWPGENCSTFAEHVWAVNGFDERLQSSQEDREFAQRLANLGVTVHSIRYRCPVFHLEHERPYREPITVESDRAFIQRLHEERVIQTSAGLVPKAGLPATGGWPRVAGQ